MKKTFGKNKYTIKTAYQNDELDEILQEILKQIPPTEYIANIETVREEFECIFRKKKLKINNKRKV